MGTEINVNYYSTPSHSTPLTREELSCGCSELDPIGCEVGLSNVYPLQLPRGLHPVLPHCCADIHRPRFARVVKRQGTLQRGKLEHI